MSRVNIYAIAKEVGVSPATVSKALNHPEQVSSKTRTKVLKAIEELGFIPSMLSKRNDTVAVVYHWWENVFLNYYFSRLINGIVGELEKFHLNLLFVSPERCSSPQAWQTFLHQHHAIGVLIINPPQGNKRFESLFALGGRVVAVGSRVEEYPVHFVDCENTHSTLTALQYLFDLGHRAIGFIGGDLSQLDHWERFSAYLDFMKTRDLYREEYVVISEDVSSFLSGRGAWEGIKRLLRLPLPPTAVFIGSGNCLLGVLRGIHECGKRVPEDVSLICFDDLEEVVPGITSIRQPIEIIGRVAAEVLLSKFFNPSHATQLEKRILSCQLILRESVRSLFFERG